MNTIDTYGQICQQIEALEALKAECRKQLLEEFEAGAHAGEQFAINITHSTRTNIDYKAVCAKLQPSHQLLAAHTRHTEIDTVKVVSKRDLTATALNLKLKLVA